MSIIKIFFNIWFRFFPPPMVHYWLESKGMIARTRISKEGHFEMEIKGEKYPLKGLPRGFIMLSEKGDYPLFSKVKHTVKNIVFNFIWGELEKSIDEKTIISTVKNTALPCVFELFSGLKYYMVPPDRLVPAVKEFWRAMETIENENANIKPLKELVSFVMQEDDAYRYRVQWLMERVKFRKGDSLEKIRQKWDIGLKKMEDAEVVEDMKAKIRLLRRGILLMLQDKKIGELAVKLFNELDCRKMWLDKGDKYHFRGKYFKVDHHIYDY